jgi:aminopeptidase
VTPFGTLDAIIERYLAACSLCPFECERTARHIAALLDASPDGVDLHTAGGHVLQYDGPLETCLLNTGCFFASGDPAEAAAPAPANTSEGVAKKKRSVGGSYPFGEVISESRALSTVHGTATIFAYPNRHKRLEMASESGGAATFTVTVDRGAIVDMDSDTPAEFRAMVGLVRDVEGEAVIRELGIGLNPHLSRGRPVADITAFERQFGAHFSLGKRHPLFPKPPRPPAGKDGSPGPLPPGRVPYDYLRRRDGKFHLDVFLAAERITARGTGDTSVPPRVLVDFAKPPVAHLDG